MIAVYIGLGRKSLFSDNPGLEGLRLRYLQGAAAEPVSSSEVSPGIPESVYQGICIPYTLYRVHIYAWRVYIGLI